MRSEATDHCASAFCPKRICKISSFLLTSWSSSLTRFGIITYLKNEPSRSQTCSFSPLVRRKQKDHHNAVPFYRSLSLAVFAHAIGIGDLPGGHEHSVLPRCWREHLIEQQLQHTHTTALACRTGSSNASDDWFIESFFTEKKNCGKTLAAAAITFLLAVNDCTERSR